MHSKSIFLNQYMNHLEVFRQEDIVQVAIPQTDEVAKNIPSGHALSEVDQVFIEIFLLQKVLKELGLVPSDRFEKYVPWYLAIVLIGGHNIIKIQFQLFGFPFVFKNT